MRTTFHQLESKIASSIEYDEQLFQVNFTDGATLNIYNQAQLNTEKTLYIGKSILRVTASDLFLY